MGLLTKMVVPLLALAAMAAPAAAATLTYDLNLSLTGGPQNLTITGYVTTDGTLGEIGAGNITDWQLTSTNASGDSLTFGSAVSGSSINGQMNATAIGLFGSTGDNGFFPNTFRFEYNFVGAQNRFASLFITRLGLSAAISQSGSPGFSSAGSLTIDGSFTVGTVRTVPTPSQVPLPFALPLLAAAFGLLGLLGLSRRRMA